MFKINICASSLDLNSLPYCTVNYLVLQKYEQKIVVSAKANKSLVN